MYIIKKDQSPYTYSQQGIDRDRLDQLKTHIKFDI